MIIKLYLLFHSFINNHVIQTYSPPHPFSSPFPPFFFSSHPLPFMWVSQDPLGVIRFARIRSGGGGYLLEHGQHSLHLLQQSLTASSPSWRGGPHKTLPCSWWNVDGYSLVLFTSSSLSSWIQQPCHVQRIEFVFVKYNCSRLNFVFKFMRLSSILALDVLIVICRLSEDIYRKQLKQEKESVLLRKF